MRPRHTWAVRVVCAVLFGGLLTVPGAAAAEPAPESVNRPQPAAIEPATTVPATQLATLPTGDTVTMTMLPDGKRTFTVAPIPRPAGEVVSFRGTTRGDRFYVVPSDAEPYLAAGVVDDALFDIATLALQERAGAVPVIVTYVNAAARVAALPGQTRALPSINGVAVRLDRAAAGRFWESIDVDGPAAKRSMLTFERGVKKIWLDRTVRATLDRSVVQIGAPVAHQAGLDGTGATVAVLDTGYDPTHPDLAGKVVASANFSSAPSVTDHNGHGTHVASTVAGSGAASGGRYRGVAPGAALLVGRVLDDAGNGTSSGVIAGLEWAAAQGADVANLSLSDNNPSDGTDPLAQAVDSISTSSGMLVVAAAGNKFNLRTVYAPGAARSALTVGAVDRGDRLANFSSRGPGLTDADVKPELTAPGVGIVAARAAGTNLGPIVDERYTALDGTSMATPHVAGAAAIIAQAHPGWRATELKRALTSTVQPAAARWYEQGTGRLDVARAVTQGVFASEPVSFGRFAFPQNGLPAATRPVTFTNTTAADVTLALGLDVRGWTDQPAPDGAVRLDAQTVTVPANGTATVNVSVDPAAGPTGVYGGHISGTSADKRIQVRSAVSWRKEGETAPLTVRVVNSRGGAPAFAGVRMIKVDGPDPNDPFVDQFPSMTAVNGAANARVARGTYHVYTTVIENELAIRRTTLAAAPEVAVPGQAEVVLDARQARSLRPALPERTDQVVAAFGFTRGTPGGDQPGEMTVLFPGSIEVYATPSGPLSQGFYSVYDQWTLQPPLLSARAGSLALHPEYDVLRAAPKLVGDRTLDLAPPGADVRNKIALVRLPAPAGVGEAHALAQRATDDAARAGAVAVLLYVDSPGALPLLNLAGEPILQLALTRSEGEDLRRLAARHRVRVSLSGTLNPSRLYQLRFEHPDGVPADYRRVVDPLRLARVNARYHSDKPNLGYTSTWFALSARHQSAFMLGRPFYAPAAFTELIGELGDHYYWNRNTAQATSPFVFAPQQVRALDQFRADTPPRDESWFASPVRVGVPEQLAGTVEQIFCDGCRDGNILVPPQNEVDSAGRHFHWLFDSGAGTVVRLSRGGQELPVDTSRGYPRFTLPPDTGTYRLDLDQVRQRGVPDLRTLGTRTRTSWTFQSSPPQHGQMPAQYLCRVSRFTGPCAFEPLIQLRYDLGLDLLNQARTGRAFGFVVGAGAHGAAPGRAPIAGLRLATSTDDGASWRDAIVVPLGNGRFFVLVFHPRTPGFVSLRTEAWDKAGNRVVQTVDRAYALSDRFAG